MTSIAKVLLICLLTSITSTANEPIPLDPGVGGNSLDTRALRPGDIIVTTTDATKAAPVIREVTNSPVSHAILVIGDGKVIESVLNGVRLVTLAEALDDAKLAVVFRHPQLTAEARSKVVAFARDQRAKDFNKAGIGRQFLCYQRDVLCSYPSAGDRWFCSELVIEAYRAANVPLLLTTARGKAPGEFARNSVLEYVGHLRTP